jgi:micrococcal nuclease
MKRKSIIILIVVLGFFLTACGTDEIHYRGKLKLSWPFGKKYDYNNILVTQVIDGDTIELENRERVRLIGIDTPEAWFSSKLDRDVERTKRNYKTIIKMGRSATRIARGLAEGKRVRLEFDAEERDTYGRLLAYVYLPDGRMLNAELLKEGYAKVYMFPPNLKYVDKFLELQEQARKNNLGFWKK